MQKPTYAQAAMNREELIRKLYSHPLSEFQPGELERRDTTDLGRLLRLLDGIEEAQSSYDSGDNFNKLRLLGDEPPILTEEDEIILDSIWAKIVEEDKRGQAS
jgi:hypothetical protein